MTKIPAPMLPANVTSLDARKQNQAAASADFGALFAASDNNYGFAEGLLSNLAGMQNSAAGMLLPQTYIPKTFAFTPNFLDTFGGSGPLLSFIDQITSKLGLSMTQNLALQDIAVRNKDATRTPESVQRIARELKEAGFNYS